MADDLMRTPRGNDSDSESGSSDPSGLAEFAPTTMDRMMSNPEVAARIGDKLNHIVQVEAGLRGDDVTKTRFMNPMGGKLFTAMDSLKQHVGGAIFDMIRMALDTKQSFANAKQGAQLNEIRAKQVMGNPLTDEQVKFADQLSEARHANPFTSKFEDEGGVAGFFHAIPGKAGEMAGGLVGDAPVIAGYAAGGASAGALYGAATGSLAGGVGAGPGAAAGALTGAGHGLAVGMGVSMGVQAMGGFYDEMKRAKMADGKPVPDDVAKGAAMVLGIINGAVGVLPVGSLVSKLPIAQRLAGAGGSAFMRQLLVQPGAMGVLKRAAVATSAAELLNIGVGVIQDLNSFVAEKFVTKGASEDYSTERLGRTVKGAAQLGLVFGAGEMAKGEAMRPREIAGKASESAQAVANYSNLGTLHEVPLFMQDKSQLKDLVQRLADANKMPQVTFPHEKLAKYLADIGLQGEDLKTAMPEVHRQMEAAAGDAKAEIRLTPAEVATYLAGDKQFDGIKGDLRSGNNYTLNEITKLSKDAQKQLEMPAPTEMDKGIKPVFDEVFAQAHKATGESASAEMAATLYVNGVKSLADATGLSPQDVHGIIGLKVVKKLAAHLDERAAGIPGTDVADASKYNIADFKADVPASLQGWMAQLRAAADRQSSKPRPAETGTWQEAFELLKTTTGNPSTAANVLAGLGYDGVDTGQRKVIWRPDITLPVSDPLSVTRGATDFQVGRTTVSLTEHQNIATIAHEFAHVFLRAWEQGANDDPHYKTLRTWLGAEEGGKLETVHEEKFARAFIDNLRTGKLGKLDPAFSKFSGWLTALYKAETALGAPIPKEIGLVMDRMMASHEAVAQAERQLSRPMFDSAEKAGMTAEQFAKYQSMMKTAAATEQNSLSRQLLSQMNDASILAFEEKKKAVRNQLIADDVRHSMVSLIKTGERLDGGNVPISMSMEEPMLMYRDRAAGQDLGVAFRHEQMENNQQPERVRIQNSFDINRVDFQKLLDAGIEAGETRSNTLRDFKENLAKAGYEALRVQDNQGVLPDSWFLFSEKAARRNDFINTDSLRAEGADPVTLARMEVLGLHSPDGAIDWHDYAKAFGYEDGAAAIDAFRNYTPLDAATAQEAAKQMPGWVDPRSWLAGRALDKLSGDAIPKMLHAELRALKGIGGDFTSDMTTLRAVAKRDISRQQISSLEPAHLLREYYRLGEEAKSAHEAGDTANAQEFKQKQILAFEGWRAAREAMEDASKFNERTVQLRDDQALRERLKRPGEQHLAAIDAALAAYGIGDKKTVPRDFNLNKYLESQTHADIITDANMEGRTDSQVQVHDFTVQDLRLAHRFIDSLVHHVEQVDEFRAGPTAKPLQLAVTRLVEHIKENRDIIQRELRNPASEFFQSGARKAAAEILRAEFMFKILDNGDVHGFLNQTLFQPIVEASAKKNQMGDAVRNSLQGVIDRYTSEENRTRLDSMSDFHVRDRDTLNKITGQMDPTQGKRLRKSELMVLLLNYGTTLNREAALKGYRITHEELMGAFERNLTKNDAEFVRNIWGTMGAVLPDVAATFEKRSGVPLEAVTPSPLKLKLLDGEMQLEGGYYPIKMSADATLTRALRGDFNTMEMEHSFTYSRQGSFGPLDLNLASSVSHLQRKVHYAAMYDAVQEVGKVLRHPDFIKAIDDTMGHEYNKTTGDWLTNITKEGLSPEMLGWWDRAVKNVMSGVAQAALGLNSKTAFMQTVGLLPVFKNVDSKHIAGAMADVLGNWHETVTNAELQSRELGNIRIDLANSKWKMLIPDVTVSPTIEAQMKALGRGKIFGTAGEVRDYLQQLGMSHLAAVQKFVNVVTFEAGKRQAIAEGRPDPVAYADALIRQSQGGADLKDLPSIMARPGLARAEIMFYSYMSVLANEVLETGYKFSGGQGVTKASLLALTATGLTYFLMPNTVQYMVDQKYKDKPVGRGISDAGWFMRSQLGLSSSRMLPVFGDLAGSLIAPDAPGHGFGPLGQVSGAARNVMLSMVRSDKHFDGESLSTLVSAIGKVPAHHLFQGLELMYFAADGKIGDPGKAWNVYIRGPKKEGLR